MTNRNRKPGKRQRRTLRLEQFEARRLLTANVESSPLDSHEDVNGDGTVTAMDALMIINQMNRARLGDHAPGPEVMDVNGDGMIGASDVLRIINRMRRDRLGNGPRMPPGTITEFRSIDGTGNNLGSPSWGSAGIELARLVDAVYADEIGDPVADRPSARLVSNLVSAQEMPMPNARGLSDFAWQWGQFIDHDIDLTQGSDENEAMNISVPQGDPMFDPAGTGDAEIGMTRSAAAAGTGVDTPRQQVNQITSFIDGSMIYGSDAVRATTLRTLSGGRLKTSDGDLLPFNETGLPNAMSTSATFFLAGDVRANEQVGLTSMHTLWVREHNRIADSIHAENPLLTDEVVYQQARAIVIGEIQAITFNEYLPAILGHGAIPGYSGYDPSVDPSISNMFATSAFRFGHTQLPSDLLRLEDDGSVIGDGNLPLRDAFFNPSRITNEGGIEPILKGLATGVAQQIDTKLVDDVRNFLFGPPGSGGFDLASLNIQRGRDHGLPDYNTVREQLGLGRVDSFDDITSDPELQAALEEVYGSVNEIDVWVGGLAEDHVPGANVGQLLRKVISDQFRAIRDGDRFWYQNTFTGEKLASIQRTRLSDVIERNTGLTSIQRNAFFAPGAGPPLASGNLA